MVRTSADLNKLAEALAAAQAKFPAISKERTARVESRKGEGSSYSYHYADLSDVLAAVRPHLAEHGLAILQPMAWSGSPWLVTRLIHSSGQWIESVYRLTEYERPQDMGSAITYARRYAITALLGIAAEEDDDGARAQTGTQRGKKAMPDCPACGNPERVIESKFGAGFYCHGCKQKFGRIPAEEPKESRPETRPAPARAAEPPIEDNDGFPVAPDAHERHGVEPTRQQKPKASGPKPECPKCGSAQRVNTSRYPKPGKELWCGACAEGFAQ